MTSSASDSDVGGFGVCGKRAAKRLQAKKVVVIPSSHCGSLTCAYSLGEDTLIEEQESISEDVLHLDLNDVMEEMAVPELLSPLSSILSESGYDSSSNSGFGGRVSPSADDSLSDLFPDLAFHSLLP